jgi:predicted RNase H-like nuclease (RuvC/YqgF family)
MAMSQRMLGAAFVSLLVACGAGEPGPKADEGKSTVQLEQEVDTAETPQLEQAVENYRSEMASLEEKQLELQRQVEEIALEVKERTLDAFAGGAGEGQQLEERLETLRAEMQQVLQELEQLATQLDVYVRELASRA